MKKIGSPLLIILIFTTASYVWADTLGDIGDAGYARHDIAFVWNGTRHIPSVGVYPAYTKYADDIFGTSLSELQYFVPGRQVIPGMRSSTEDMDVYKSDVAALVNNKAGIQVDQEAADSFQSINIWRSIGSVVFVLGAMLSVSAYLKRRQSGAFRGSAGKRIKILEKVPFDARRSFVILEADGRRILVGAGTESFQTLSDLGSVDEAEGWPGEMKHWPKESAIHGQAVASNNFGGGLRIVKHEEAGNDGK